MNAPNALRALIWKDARIIFPLVVIAVLTSFASHLLLLLLWRVFAVETSTLDGWPLALWTLIPGLVAFGAGASLIGTEQDSGTLIWLRSLPVSWQAVAHAKLLVGLIAFASVWSFATALFWLVSHGGIQTEQAARLTSWTWDQLLIITFLQLFLLVLGFFMAYGLRSPLIGLVLLFPLFLVIVGCFQWLLEPSDPERVSGFFSGRNLIATLLLLGFVLLQYVAAHRRLIQPLPIRGESGKPKMASSTYYQPPDFASYAKPSVSLALLWQQCRQTLPLGAVLIAGSCVLMLVFLADQDAPRGSAGAFSVFASLAPLCVTLSACWMGALAFYPDNQRNRFQFLSDRGISATQIWWTRLLPPLLGCLLLLLVFSLAHLLPGGRRFVGGWSNAWQWFSTLVVLFALGQLISQGIRRPILAFLAAPAYSFVSLIPVFYFANEMGSGFPPILTMVPVLLFASWKLAPRWLESNVGLRYAVSVFGYTALAITVPCILFFGGTVMHFAMTRL